MADYGVVDDDDESKVVTKFLLSTCRLLQPSDHHLWAAVMRFYFASVPYYPSIDDDCDEVHFIPLITGSSAEFYIKPMLSCVGDIDMMYHQSDELAITEGQPPPTELSAEFNSRVKVYEIIDSEYPGFVYLVLSYLLIEDSDAGNYNAIVQCNHTDQRCYVQNIRRHTGNSFYMPTMLELHGPALTTNFAQLAKSQDLVTCVRCLSWPSQAADWLTRHRSYGWPDSATVDRVVNNGCDVVGVPHRQCREHELASKLQWRLSFSQAEIVLLNSWMPVQQIVYHMLRVLVKTERLTDVTDGTETNVCSNYHFKTLILWACELNPQMWWTNDMNVVRICVRLLHVLADWLKNKICPHYFVNNCNLFCDTVHLDIIASRLVATTESWLSTWFVNNYLRKCAQLCPDMVSWLFDDVSTSKKLQNAVSAVVFWRVYSEPLDLWPVLKKAEFYVQLFVSSLTVMSCRFWINELVKIDCCLRSYFTAVAFLHAAKTIAKHSLNDELLNVLSTLVDQFVGKRSYCHQLSSELSLNQAVILMKVLANNSRSTVQQIEFELSKAYLHRVLRCNDSDRDSIYCLANVYLAVLYYTSGQYKTTVDHCTLVMKSKSQDHSQCSSHVVQGDLLPKVDDDIDTVLGLAVFYQYVRMAALNQQQAQYVVIFTTEMFAHYLYTRCLSVMKCRQFTQILSTDEVQRYGQYVVDMDQLFIADVLLFRQIKMLSEPTCHYKPLSVSEQQQNSAINAAELDTSELVELLQQSAVEHLTEFHQVVAERIGAVVTIVTTDFESLYAYKRGEYQRCLQLSIPIIHTLLYNNAMSSVSTIPEFIQMMDDDIVSLIALTMIVDPERRQLVFRFYIDQLTLSLYLMTQCQLKLHHSVTSLAQTLDYIEFARRRCSDARTLSPLILKLTKRKIMIYLSKIMECLKQSVLLRSLIFS